MRKPQSDRTDQVYSQEEMNFIESNAGKMPIDVIAKRLRRPVRGIEEKMKRIGCLGAHEHLGTYTAFQLSDILGVSKYCAYRWIKNNGLPAERRKQYEGNERERYHIHIEEFWEWAEAHKHLIDCSKFSRYDLPPEPDWVHKKRLEDQNKRPIQKIWTPEEDQKMFSLIEMGKTQKEVAEILNRGKASIEHRLKFLRDKGTTDENNQRTKTKIIV